MNQDYDAWKTTEPDDREPCHYCGSTSHVGSRCPDGLADAAERRADEFREEPTVWDKRQYEYWERMM